MLALFVLPSERVHAAVDVQLAPALTSPQPVGTTVIWTAIATDTNPGSFDYQFSVRLSGGDYSILRDYATSNTFAWTPSELEGSFDVRVDARNLTTGEAQQVEVSYTLTSRVTGDSAVISTTGNPLVALYSAPPCAAGSMRVRFWRTGDFTSQTTSWKSCLPEVSRNFYVAGMRPATAYGMRHEVSFDPEAPSAVGPTLSFTTGAVPTTGFNPPASSVVIPSAGDSGQEVLLHGLLNRATAPFITATDLSGALLWYYANDSSVQYVTRPSEGGTMLIVRNSQQMLREIGLAGNLVRETSIQAVSEQLAVRGANPITSFHHEARRLADGKTVVLAGTERLLSDVQGPGPVAIVGDMIVVLDENWRVIWHWDAFDHLDVTRKALGDEKCPQLCITPSPTANDWTHANAIGYSPADGNLVLSIRHQAWVIKIAYEDGAGDGSVVWKLGNEGDFTIDSDDPYPWFSYQHDSDYVPGDPNALMVFDNGNLRQPVPGATKNSRGQILNLDEVNKTATLQLNADLGVYAAALGSAQKLLSGNFHFEAGFLGAAARAVETNPDSSLAFVLQTQNLTYRSFRMRDLYTPGAPDGEDQTISFGDIADQTFGGVTLDLSATASSELPVSFRIVSGPATLSDNTLTITGAGTVVVQADQDGNIRYNSAPSVRQTFEVNKAGSTTVVTISDATYDGLPHGGTAVVTGVGGLSQSVTVTYSGRNTTTYGPSTTAPTNAGDYTASATFAGDANHDGSSDSENFQLAKANQTITFGALANKSFGNPDFTVSATASSGLTVSFSAAGNCTVSGSTVHLTGAGACTVTASQPGNGNYNAATPVEQSFNIAKVAQTLTFGALTNKTFGAAPFTVSATGGASGNPVTFAASGNCSAGGTNGATITITGAGSCTVTASQVGNANYIAAADVARTFQIAKASQVINITMHAPASAIFNSQFTVGATGGASGNPVTFAASGACTNSGATYTKTSGTGICTVIYSQAGNANYEGAQATETVNAGKAAQTISFAALSDKTFGNLDFGVTASASSGLVVSFAAEGACTVDGSTVHITGAGTCTITASQVGDGNYSTAPSVGRSFSIAKAITTTALSSSSNPSGTGQAVTFTATVNSAADTPNGQVQFKVDGANVGSPVTLNSSGVATHTTSALTAGSHTITAEYGGGPNFNTSSGALSGAQVVGGLFGFSLPLFTVAERGGSITITVKRSGNTAGAASVDYATDDGSIPSVSVPCSSVTGLALGRCDYTSAVGTLHFAAGEVERTFVVLVNDDSFVEGTETTQLRLSNASNGAALGSLPSAALEITDDQTESAGNPSDDDEAFVRQHYHDFLGRAPDAEGLKFWVDGINECGADANCREAKRLHTSAAFFLSIEFQNTGVFAYLIHKSASGNINGTPVPLSFEDFTEDTQALGRELIVGQPGWEQKLAANKAAYALEFVQRPEFLTLYPAQMPAAAFVDMLNANGGGVLTNAERTALITELSPNPADASLRASVLRKVSENAQFTQAETNRAFVLMEYFGYLRRHPNAAPNTDFSGYNFWLGKLEEFHGDYIAAEMVKAFINSIEYRNRFGQ